MYGRHAFPHWLLALAVLLSGATARTVSGYLPQATGASALSIQDAEIVELLEAAEVLPGDGRRLLHDGCHRRECMPRCPKCKLPKNSNMGHCRKNNRRHECQRRPRERGWATVEDIIDDGDDDTGNEGNEGDVGMVDPLDDSNEGDKGDVGMVDPLDDGNEGDEGEEGMVDPSDDSNEGNKGE